MVRVIAAVAIAALAGCRDTAGGALDTQADPVNCGASGHACPGTDGGVAVCVSGKCEVACGDGLRREGASCVTGCGDTAADPLNCGACAHVCPSPANGIATCAAGSCGVACSTGFHVSGAACVACGDTQGDRDNCGACGHVCAAPADADALCAGGACDFTCHAGFHRAGAGCTSDDGSGGSQNSNILLRVTITWNNSQTGTSTDDLELQILDSQGKPVGDAVKHETSGVMSSSPITTTDQISVSFPQSTGVTYSVTMLSCSVSNGTGSVIAGSFPTVSITCN